MALTPTFDGVLAEEDAHAAAAAVLREEADELHAARVRDHLLFEELPEPAHVLARVHLVVL